MTIQVPEIASMAAQLRLKIDRKRGVETPPALRKLAKSHELSLQDIQDARQAVAIN
jgi:hypothetical protein